MATTVVGFFDTLAEAQNVVTTLAQRGVSAQQIKLVVSNARTEQERSIGDTMRHSSAELAQLGLPTPQAQVYAEGLRRGGAIVAVTADDAMAPQIHEVFRTAGAANPEALGTSYRASGWSDTAPSNGPLDSEAAGRWERSDQTGTAGNATAGAVQGAVIGAIAGPAGIAIGSVIGAAVGGAVGAAADVAGQAQQEGNATQDIADFNDYHAAFQQHYASNYANSGYSLEQFLEIYRYGFTLSRDPKYIIKPWDVTDTDARRAWEERNPNSWEFFKDAVHFGWEQARLRTAAPRF